ncbi:hypothetical protein [Variovorax sp. PvP013]|jgi:hypothetical protein|uniref:hypothetical protein n=1 Tax=Variovorax sp. PvP013 TaxID=3156435 RepID=UPI003D1E059D
MKRPRKINLMLLLTAAIAGCSVPPRIQAVETAPLTATASLVMPAKSCIERSAATLPPKHPIVELVWCIAETDELYDPGHLFSRTLGIKNYKTSEGITWGVQAAAGAEENAHLPKGMLSFLFMRKNPEGLKELGDRYLSIVLEPKVSCVRMEDVAAIFGKDSWLSAVPISVPNRSSNGLPRSTAIATSNPYGIFYKSPRLFMRDPSGLVDFDFRYEECVKHISIQRKLDLISYRNFQQEEK